MAGTAVFIDYVGSFTAVALVIILTTATVLATTTLTTVLVSILAG